MRISFTGTRHGMSASQSQQLLVFLRENKIMSFAHGCCVGADIEAHLIVRGELGRAVSILVFPSTARTKAPIPRDADHVAMPRPPP